METMSTQVEDMKLKVEAHRSNAMPRPNKYRNVKSLIKQFKHSVRQYAEKDCYSSQMHLALQQWRSVLASVTVFVDLFLSQAYRSRLFLRFRLTLPLLEDPTRP